MIDIHSHILYDVDDGSDSLENTLDILRKAENAGFSDIILTPHYIEGYNENTKRMIKERIAELKKDLYDQDIIIELHQGNEILLSENTPELLKNSNISTIGDSRYILFEIPFSNRILNLEHMIYILRENGYIPILAHPERYSFIQDDPNEIINIIKSGVLIQCNYGSLLGQYGKVAKQVAELFLENHLIHFLGTDTHKQGFVFENMKTLMKKIDDIAVDEKYVNEITYKNAKKVLNDLDIEIDCPEGIKERKKNFFFF